MNIFNKLDQIIDLTDNEKVLVAYMKQHTDDFMKYNATQIAEKCYVSISTIYRLCHKLGITGLSDLKLQVSASIEDYLKAVSYTHLDVYKRQVLEQLNLDLGIFKMLKMVLSLF